MKYSNKIGLELTNSILGTMYMMLNMKQRKELHNDFGGDCVGDLVDIIENELKKG